MRNNKQNDKRPTNRKRKGRNDMMVNKAKQIIVIVLLAPLFSCIIFPLFLALFLSFLLSLNVRAENYLYISSVFEILAFSTSFFLMGLVVSFLNKDAEMTTTIFTSLLSILILCFYSYGNLVLLIQRKQIYFILEFIIGIFALLIFAMLAACVVIKYRRMK